MRSLLVDGAVADDHRSVVGRRGEQRVKSVIGHAPHCLLMVSADNNTNIIISIINNNINNNV